MKLLSITKSPYHGKNITEAEVPSELRVKHKTGIEWVDFVLGGGFTPSTCWMVTGDPGCGKTTLALTIADALTASGHTALVNGREEAVYQVKMAIERLGLKHGFIFGEDIIVEDVVKHAERLQRKAKPGTRVVTIVDSLQCLDDGKYDTGKRTKNTPVNCAEALIGWAKETLGILLFVNHVTKDGVFVGDNTLLHAVDGHLHLGFDRGKKSPTYGERILKKNKDRFGPAVPPAVIEMGLGGRLSLKVMDEDEDDEAAA